MEWIFRDYDRSLKQVKNPTAQGIYGVVWSEHVWKVIGEEYKTTKMPQWLARKSEISCYKLLGCVLWGNILPTYTGIFIPDSHR